MQSCLAPASFDAWLVELMIVFLWIVVGETSPKSTNIAKVVQEADKRSVAQDICAAPVVFLYNDSHHAG